jgi:hypothetical protein
VSEDFENDVWKEVLAAASHLEGVYKLLIDASSRLADSMAFNPEWVLKSVTLPKRVDERQDASRIVKAVIGQKETVRQFWLDNRRERERAKLLERLNLTKEEMKILGLEGDDA